MESHLLQHMNKDRTEWCQDYKSELIFLHLCCVSYLNKTFKGGKGKGGLRDLTMILVVSLMLKNFKKMKLIKYLLLGHSTQTQRKLH